jgi:hypothetical protein
VKGRGAKVVRISTRWDVGLRVRRCGIRFRMVPRLDQVGAHGLVSQVPEPLYKRKRCSE